MYTYNRVTSICIDLSKIKLFVFVFVKITFCKQTYHEPSKNLANSRSQNLVNFLQYV